MRRLPALFLALTLLVMPVSTLPVAANPADVSSDPHVDRSPESTEDFSLPSWFLLPASPTSPSPSSDSSDAPTTRDQDAPPPPELPPLPGGWEGQDTSTQPADEENPIPDDPRYVPVPPPDPDRIDEQEAPSGEGGVGEAMKPDAPLYSYPDCVPSTDLAVASQYLDSPPYPGAEIEYQITVQNQGNAAARDVRITDTLPMSVTYISDSPPKGFTTVITTGGVVVWERRVPMNPDETALLTLRVRVNDTATVGSSLSNTVVITTSDTDAIPSNNTSTRIDSVVALNRDLQLYKSWYSGFPVAGDDVVYRLHFLNNGNADAHDVLLTDTLPVSVTYVSWYGYAYSPYYDIDEAIAPTVASGQIVWALGELEPGQYGYIYVTVHISDTAPIGTVLTNTAVITTSDADTNPGNETDTYVTTVITPSWDMFLTKALYVSPVAGEEMIYELYFKNNGNRTVHNVLLTDTLPVSVTYISWSSSSWYESHELLGHQVDETFITGTNQIVWPLGTMEPGDYDYIYLTVSVSDTAPVGGELVNTAVVTGDVESNPGDNTAVLTNTIVSATRDLYVYKSKTGGPLSPDSDLTYQIYLINQGNATAHDVVLTDTLPPSVTLVSWYGDMNSPSYDIDETIVPTISNGRIVWAFGELKPGQNGNIYVTVHISDTAPVGGVLTNTAVITTSDVDTDPSNNESIQASSVAAGFRDLHITKSRSGGSTAPGGQLTYKLYIGNQGNSAASDVVVTDTLPPSTTFVSWSSSSWGTIHDLFGHRVTETVIPATNQIVWNIGEVAENEYEHIYLRVNVSDAAPVGGILTNTATIATGDVESNLSNNTAVHTDTVSAPTRDIFINKSLYGSAKPVPGGEIVYKLYLGNTGDSVAHDVVLTDTLPSNATYLYWSSSPYWRSHFLFGRNVEASILTSTNQIVWNVGEIEDWYSGYIYVTVQVTDTAAIRDVLCNRAQISTSDTDNDLSNNTYTSTHTVNYPLVDLSVEKSLYSQAGAPGGNMVYRIHLENLGVAPAENVLVTDTLPAGVTLVSWSGDPISLAEIPGGKLVWMLESVSPGSNEYIYVTVHLDDALQVGTPLTNTVSVSSDGEELDWRDNEYTLVTEVVTPTYDMYASKSLRSSVVPGELVEYRISVSNDGNSTATGVILTDTIPPSMTFVSWDGRIYNPSGLLPDPIVQDGQLIWRIGEMAAGQYIRLDVTFLLDEGASPGDTLTNTVAVTLTEKDVNPVDNEYSRGDVVSAPERDVGVSKQRSGVPGRPGGLLVYNIDFYNNGNARARDVVITDTLPPGVAYESWRGYVDTSYYGTLEHLITPTFDGQQIIWHIPEVPAGGEGYIELTVRVSDSITVGTVLTNSAVITTSDPDSDPDNNSYVLTDAITEVWEINVMKYAYVAPMPGEEIVYSIVFWNTGNMTADVVITDVWTSEMTFVSWNGYYYNGSGVVYLCDSDAVINEAERWGRWTVEGLLPRGAGYGYIYVTLRVADEQTVSAGDELVNVAIASAGEDGTVMTSDIYTATYTVVEPAVDVYASNQVDIAGSPGGLMRYAISFGNYGYDTAHDVVLTVTLPQSVTFVSWISDSNVCEINLNITPTVSNGQVVWSLGEIAPRSYADIYVIARISNTVKTGRMLFSRVNISTSDDDDDISDNESSLRYWVRGRPSLHAYKSLSSRPGTSGGLMQYSINIGNSGQAAQITATNVIVTDTLPVSTSLVSWDGEVCYSVITQISQQCNSLQASPTISGRKVIWQLGDIPPDSNATLHLTVRVEDEAAVWNYLGNSVIATCDEIEDEYRDNKSSNDTRVTLPWVDLYTYKYLKGDYRVIPPGDEIEYLIYFGNGGNITATDVVITDLLPAYTEYITWSGYLNGAGMAGSVTFTVQDGLASWYLGDLPPDVMYGYSYYGGYIYLTVQLSDTITACEKFTNTVMIAGNEEDFDSTDNLYRLTARVGEVIPLTGVSISGPVTTTTGQGTAFTATVSPVTATVSRYTWSSENLVSGQGTANAIYLWSQAGRYTITVRAENAEGSVTATRIVTVEAAPCNAVTGVSIAGPTEGYTGTTYAFAATVAPANASAPVTYTWSPEPSSGQGTSHATYSWDNTGAQVITVRAANCGGVATGTHTITITTQPVTCPVPLTGVAIAGPTRAYSGSNYTFAAVITPANATAPVTYTWSPAPGGGQGTSQASYSWNTTGTVTLTLVARNCGGTFTATHVVAVEAPPAGCPKPLVGVSVSGPTEGYTDTAYTFSAAINPTDATAPVTYTWSPAPSSGQGTASAVYSWSSTGAQVITVRAENCGGVATDTHIITITARPVTCPVPLTGVAIAGPTEGYTGTNYAFAAVITPANASTPIAYTWSPEPSSGQGTAAAVYSWDTTGDKQISVEARNCGGTFSAQHTISIVRVEPFSTTVGPGQGGTIVYTDTQGMTTTVRIPAGAVTETTVIVFTPVPSPTQPVSTGLRFGNHAFDLDAYRNGQPVSDFSPSKPVTITIRYSDEDVAGVDERTLALYRWIASPGYWERIGARQGEGQELHADINLLRAWLRGFSRFGTYGAKSAQNRIFLPLVLRNYR